MRWPGRTDSLGRISTLGRRLKTGEADPRQRLWLELAREALR